MRCFPESAQEYTDVKVPEYFCLLRPESERLFASSDDSAEDEMTVVTTCSDHRRLRRTGPLALQLGHNRRDQAMIFSWIGDLVILNELADKLSENGITGFRLLAGDSAVS